MATKTIYLKGKLKWAHTARPDKYNNWSTVLYPDEESLKVVWDLKNGKPAILNTIGKDEDGEFIKLSRPQNKTINGTVRPFAAPPVVDANGIPITQTLIGNGSDGTVKCAVYDYRKGEGKAIRLEAIRVDNLIPFVPQTDFNPEEQKLVQGLDSEPAPNF